MHLIVKIFSVVDCTRLSNNCNWTWLSLPELTGSCFRIGNFFQYNFYDRNEVFTVYTNQSVKNDVHKLNSKFERSVSKSEVFVYSGQIQSLSFRVVKFKLNAKHPWKHQYIQNSHWKSSHGLCNAQKLLLWLN